MSALRGTGGGEPCERAARATLPVLDGVDQDDVARAYAAAVLGIVLPLLPPLSATAQQLPPHGFLFWSALCWRSQPARCGSRIT